MYKGTNDDDDDVDSELHLTSDYVIINIIIN